MNSTPTLDTNLFEIVPQWRLRNLQLVNWGTFHGYHSIPLAPNTLISGPSGSGKSTLLDAYTALMTESSTPFNGASNEGKGRARGKDQRSALSYIRGAIDTVRDLETGELVDDVLRGSTTATWSAIAATFHNDDGRDFTVLRIYYARVGASLASDLTMRMLTMTGALNLKGLEEFAVNKFLPRELTGRYPTLRNHDSYATFSQSLHTQLGIGQNGNGSRAMKLLARIQGGHQVNSVDALYKQLVLEKPETYDKADLVIAHFDDLAKTHAAMQTAALKVETLKAIPDLHSAMIAAKHEREAIDTFRIHSDDPTPFSLWKLLTERRMLDDAVLANRSAHKVANDAFRSSSANEKDLKLRLDQNRDDQRSNGGEALERIEQRMCDLKVGLERATDDLGLFSSRVEPLKRPPVQNEQDFITMANDAQDFLHTFADQDKEITTQLDATKHQAWTLQNKRQDLAAEHESLRGRTTKLHRRYLEARAQIAERTGMDVSDLPFVAELIDIHSDQERWRPAAEQVMRGIATTMLLPRGANEHLRRRIDALSLRHRINFLAVPTDRSGTSAPTGSLAAALIFAESPFRGWLQQELSKRFDHQCVETADDFIDDNTRQVTIAGQVKDGYRGAHGGNTGEFFIGFSNDLYRQQVKQDLHELDTVLAKLVSDGNNLNDQQERLRDCRAANQFVLDTKWDKIDVAALARLLSDAGEELSRMREANSTLLGLEKEHGTLSEEHDQANRIRVRAEEEIFHLEQRHGPLVDRQDRVSDSIEEAKETVMLSDDQQIHLDEAFAEHGIVDDLTRLADSFNKVKRHLAERSKEANGSENAAIDSLERVFAAYQRMWFDADLGSSVKSYTDYRTVLDALVAEGLPERRATFKREIALWTGRDLVTLAHSVRESVSHIEDRLRAVNDILDKIPFGREHDRLRIKLRRLTNPKVRDFIQRLNRIAAGATARYADEETDARFEEISSFINLVRPSDSLPKGASYTRDTLLDVHRHITITAERIDADENQLSVYDSLGGKSGGETQELVAFIVGAALRYQLGDEASSTRPGFAPVLLDEGFIKADAEFAGRAVQAWKRLGFQLIIGAPLDKVSGIETHMDLMLGVNKPRNHSIVSPLSKVATSVVDAL